MKAWKKGALVLFLFGGWLSLQIGSEAAFTYSSGAPGGHTGSQGDGGKTCAQAGCHSSFSPILASSNAEIQTNIPASGYVPGSTYTVTAKISKGNSSFGFEVNAEDDSGQKVGTFIITQANETQTTNNGDAVTHSIGGTGGAGNRTWNFDWQAPSPGVGPVTFSGAFNEANGNGQPTGDSIHTDSLVVEQDSSLLILPFAGKRKAKSLSVYPVPASERITLSKIPYSGQGKVILLAPRGRSVEMLYQGSLGRELVFSLPSDLKGLHFLRIESQGRQILHPILIR